MTSRVRTCARARHGHRRAASAALTALGLALCVAGMAAPALAQDTLRLSVAEGTKLRKLFKTSHELSVDQIGFAEGDGPLLSDGSAGWVSGSQRIEVVDEYVRADAARPLELARTFEDISGTGTITVAVPGSQKREERSRSDSPLKGNRVRYTWVEAEHGYSRCFDQFEDEEALLVPLVFDFDLQALLPPGPVTTGTSWAIEPASLRNVLAPGGNLTMTPTGGNLFGRSMEIGIAGDFADFLDTIDGQASATYQGTREIPAVGEQPALRLGVVEVAIEIVAHGDRTQLYRMAMPKDERRRPERLESALLDYSLAGKGELLWDLAAGHARSFSFDGQESFTATVNKTTTGAQPTKFVQQSRFSGKLELKFSTSDGSVAREDAGNEPKEKKSKTGGRKGKKK